MISINTTELYEILDLTPARQNIMLVGRHGIGKSQILTAYFEQKGFRVVSLFLGQMSDPGDLIGLPVKDAETGKTTFMPPYWFPTNGEPVVLFLDELNRARPEVLQTIMDLALNRKLAGRSLPEGSRIISAVNDGEEYQLTDLDPALVSRFNVYAFRPVVEEWLLWASQSGLDERVVNFIQDSPSWLDGNDKVGKSVDTGLERTPDRRSWHKVSDAICGISELRPIHQKAIAGIVGVTAAAKFVAFANDSQVVSGQDVLLKFEMVEARLSKYRVHELAQVNDSIYRYLESAPIDTPYRKQAGANLLAYINLVEKGSQKEALAHFASSFSKGTYQKAVAFIMSESPNVFARLMTYIQNL